MGRRADRWENAVLFDGERRRQVRPVHGGRYVEEADDEKLGRGLPIGKAYGGVLRADSGTNAGADGIADRVSNGQADAGNVFSHAGSHGVSNAVSNAFADTTTEHDANISAFAFAYAYAYVGPDSG